MSIDVILPYSSRGLTSTAIPNQASAPVDRRSHHWAAALILESATGSCPRQSLNCGGFRIPMRGYENSKELPLLSSALVPNPHEGL